MNQKNPHSPTAAHPDNGSGAPGPNSSARQSNGSQPASEEPAPLPVVRIDAFLAQLSERLAAAGSLSLARSLDGPTTGLVEQTRVVSFALGGVRYGLEIQFVSEVARHRDIMPVPGLPGWVVGVVNLHGEIVSAVDLARFLDLDPPANRLLPELMVVAQAADQKIGLMVDRVDQIVTVPTESIISPPFKISLALVPFLRGVVERGDQFIRLLDCERLLLGPQMQQFS